MILLTDYTSADEIRAVLGVSEYEISDAQLELPLYSSVLQRSLRAFTGTFGGVTGSLAAHYDSLLAKSELTDAEDDFRMTIREYAAYVIAETCLSGLSLAALKSESDGKATQTRFSDASTFQSVGKNIRQKLQSVAALLNDAMGEAAYTAPVFVSSMPPAIDVVTG